MKKSKSYAIETQQPQTEEKKKEINKSKKKVKIYSNPFCRFCIQLKKKLIEENLIHLVEIIEDDSKIPKKVMSQGYPFTVSGKDEYIGYPDDFKEYKKMFF